MNDADTRLDKLGDLIARGSRVAIGTREELHDFVLQLMEIVPQVIGDLKNARVPTELFCPMCNHKHIDQGDWEHKIPHRKHQCANCNHIWQPFAVGTVGVAYGHAVLPVAEHIQVLERDLAWTRGEWSAAGEEIAKLEKRRDELLQMVANLSQSVPLDSEVSEALNQRGALVAEVGTLRARVTELEKQLAGARGFVNMATEYDGNDYG